jgi:hypothetical protein
MARRTRKQPNFSWGMMAIVSIALALFSFRYLFGIGPLAPNVVTNAFASPWLMIHVAGACTALLVGSFQFVPGIRSRFPVFHRWGGRVYAAGCIVGGSSGLLLALGSTSGPVATAGFGGLATCWLITTCRGWQLAMERRFAEHREWMIRSWALTLAAVTLRLYLPVAPLLGFSFVEGYRVISFLCWVPNLVIAEIYLAGSRNTRPGTASPARA